MDNKYVFKPQTCMFRDLWMHHSENNNSHILLLHYLLTLIVAIVSHMYSFIYYDSNSTLNKFYIAFMCCVCIVTSTTYEPWQDGTPFMPKSAYQMATAFDSNNTIWLVGGVGDSQLVSFKNDVFTNYSILMDS
eukprot:35786_1